MDLSNQRIVIEQCQRKKFVWFCRDVKSITGIGEYLLYIGVLYIFFAILKSLFTIFHSLLPLQWALQLVIALAISRSLLYWPILYKENFIFCDDGIYIEFYSRVFLRQVRIINRSASPSSLAKIANWNDVKSWKAYKQTKFPFLVINTTIEGGHIYFSKKGWFIFPSGSRWFIFPSGSRRHSVEKIEEIENMLQERCWYLQYDQPHRPISRSADN